MGLWKKSIINRWKSSNTTHSCQVLKYVCACCCRRYVKLSVCSCAWRMCFQLDFSLKAKPWERLLWQQCPCWADRVRELRSNCTLCVTECATACVSVHFCICCRFIQEFISLARFRLLWYSIYTNTQWARVSNWLHLWQDDLSLSRGELW